MLKSLAKVLGFTAGLVLSGAAFAVSMGNINVTSALGEPLKAEIALMDIGKGGKSKLSVSMASSDAFKEAGLDYPASLPKLKFQIESSASGELYLSVTSSQPVNDPYVNLLVELTWPSGKLLRAYTFLLDPPGFKPEQPKAEQVQPLAPAAAEAKPASAAEEPKRATAPAEEKTVSAAAPVAKAETKPAAGRNVASGSITVKRGDTLSKIAGETKPSDVSLERMLVAMYHANEDAFDGHNMNRLRTGKILRMPEEGDLSKVEQVEAMKEIRAQVADWHAYRQKLAAAGASAGEQAPRQEASGKIATTVADKTPPAKEQKDVVRLSKGEAPGDKAAAAGAAKSAQDKLHAMQEEAITRDKMLKESQQRIAMLEKNIKEMQRLLELKGQAVPVAKPEEAKPAESKPVAVAASPAVTVSAVAPAAPAPKPAPRKVAPPPPSLLDEILGEPLYLAGGAAVLLGLGGGAFFAMRRRKGGAGKKEQPSDSAAHIAAPVPPSPDTGDFTAAAGAATAAVAAAEDVDPIKEAELFLSFGRDAQAEDILKDALAGDPGNQQIRLKLLSIYANRKDVNTFAAVAQQVHDSGDEAAWAQAAEMGHRLDPSNPMYGEVEAAEVGAAPEEEATITQTSSNLDFDLGMGEQAAAGQAEVPAEETTFSGLDFDVGSVAPAEEPAAEEELSAGETAADTSVMDFDLGMVAPAAEEPEAEPAVEAQESAGGLDFDITAEYPGLKEAEPAAEAPAAAEGLDLDVTGTFAAAEETAEPVGLADIALDFPAAEEPVAEEPAAEEAQQPAKESALDLGEISLELEPPAPKAAPAAAAEEEAKDAHWHDVATKLDLARAYHEMGDAAGAREILEEVLKEGDAEQRALAQSMIQQLS